VEADFTGESVVGHAQRYVRGRFRTSRVDKLPFNRRKKHHVSQKTGKQSREKSRRVCRGAEWPIRLVLGLIKL